MPRSECDTLPINARKLTRHQLRAQYFAARCIFNSLWSNTVFRIDILRQSARSPCQLFIYLFVLCLWLYSCSQIFLICYFFAQGRALARLAVAIS